MHISVCVFKNPLETIPQFLGAKATIEPESAAATESTRPDEDKRDICSKPSCNLGSGRVSHQVSTEVLENWPSDP